MELDKGGLSRIVDETESVHTETRHHSESALYGDVSYEPMFLAKTLTVRYSRSWDSSITEDPHVHMSRLRREGHPIPSVVMSGLRLRNLIVRFRFYHV